MVALVPSRSAVPLLAVVALTLGCQSSLPPAPVRVEPGRRTVVRLLQFRDGQVMTMSLQNLSSGSRREVYSDRGGEPGAKVIDDDELQRLLDVLAQQGIFEHPGGAPADARDVLMVQQDDRRYVLSRRLQGRDPAELPFFEAQSYFLAVWNQAIAFRSSDANRADLRAEQEKAIQSGQNSVKKLETMGGRR